MANHYVLFSTSIDDLSKEEKDWCRAELDRMEEDEDCTETDYSGLDGLDYIFGPDYLILYSEEGADPDTAAGFIQLFLGKWRPQQVMGFTWAETCSKPRPDEFGGGAVCITATSSQWMNCHSWLDNTIKKNREG